MFESSVQVLKSLRQRARSWHDSERAERLLAATRRRSAEGGRLLFLTPDYDHPAGGIRVIYSHVDALNAAGMPAHVVHWRRGFRCTWFEHATSIVAIDDIAIGPDDILVVPELEIHLLAKLPRNTRHIIFNQNTFLTWQVPKYDVTSHYRAHPGLLGAIVVSEHNAEMLRMAFPDLAVERVRLSIDSKLFYPGEGPRPKRIGYMPRRGGTDARLVLEMLRANGVLDDWEVVAIDGLPHEKIGHALRQCRIFLAFTHQEGFGLPAAEAMACGCYVIGNHGGGGAEVFRPEFSTSIAPGDILGFVKAIERVVEVVPAHVLKEDGRAASTFVLGRYRSTQNLVGSYSFPPRVAEKLSA